MSGPTQIGAFERLTGIPLCDQWPAWMVGFGHGGTHWVIATYLLMVPWIRQDLGISYAEAGLILSVFHMASFVANFGSGAAVDLVGRRVVLKVISLVLGALALGAMGWAGGLLGLAGLMIIIGATNNLWHPPAISYLSSSFPKQRGYALSLHALGASIGDSLAPLATGVLIVLLGWRDTALVAAAPVLLLALLLLVTLTPKERAAEAGESKRPLGLSNYAKGLKVLVTDRWVATLCITSGFRTMTLQGLLFFLPLYLVDVMAFSPTGAGGTLTALQIGGLIATPIAGIMSDRIGRRPVVVAGFFGTTILIALITLIQHPLILVGGISVLGFVLYATRPVVHSWLMDMTPPAMSGSATSLMFGTQSLFNIAVPIVGGLIADTYGLQAVFIMLGATILAANLLVLLIPKVDAT